jgi:hypothetical protein
VGSDSHQQVQLAVRDQLGKGGNGHQDQVTNDHGEQEARQRQEVVKDVAADCKRESGTRCALGLVACGMAARESIGGVERRYQESFLGCL